MEHIVEYHQILAQGVETWNNWRTENPNIQPSFRFQNFRNANLSGANFRNTDFEGSDFEGANLANVDFDCAILRRSVLASANLCRASLCDANLFEAKLPDAKLEYTECKRANFENSNLNRANLYYADLEFAKFTGASLRECYLSSANLTNADLHSVDLTDSFLLQSNFFGASLRHAVLTRAVFSKTILTNSDLSSTKGLESTIHNGPSFMDHLSIQRSDNIPKLFLSGIGWSDWFIESTKLFNADLIAESIAEITNNIFQLRASASVQTSSLFISYSHHDADFVNALEVKLQENRIRYWRDIHDALAGPLDKILEKALLHTGTVLLVLSQNSIKSHWVKSEIETAFRLLKESKEIFLCPIALDDSWKSANWPSPLKHVLLDYIVLDFSGWQYDGKLFNNTFDRLVRGLNLFYKDVSESKGSFVNQMPSVHSTSRDKHNEQERDQQKRQIALKISQLEKLISASYLTAELGNPPEEPIQLRNELMHEWFGDDRSAYEEKLGEVRTMLNTK